MAYYPSSCSTCLMCLCDASENLKVIIYSLHRTIGCQTPGRVLGPLRFGHGCEIIWYKCLNEMEICHQFYTQHCRGMLQNCECIPSKMRNQQSQSFFRNQTPEKLGAFFYSTKRHAIFRPSEKSTSFCGKKSTQQYIIITILLQCANCKKLLIPLWLDKRNSY